MTNRLFVPVLSILALCPAMAQSSAPEFVLRISPSQSVIPVSKVTQTVFSLGEYLRRFAIEVEEANISSHTINIGTSSSDPGDWYEMKVLLDGEPAPLTKEYYAHLHPQPHPESGNRILAFGSGGSMPLEPGKTAQFRIPITDYFDMSKPGEYEITFSQGPERGQPIEILSNTTTVTVVRDSQMPPQATEGEK